MSNRIGQKEPHLDYYYLEFYEMAKKILLAYNLSWHASQMETILAKKTIEGINTTAMLV